MGCIISASPLGSQLPFLLILDICAHFCTWSYQLQKKNFFFDFFSKKIFLQKIKISGKHYDFKAPWWVLQLLKVFSKKEKFWSWQLLDGRKTALIFLKNHDFGAIFGGSQTNVKLANFNIFLIKWNF